MHHNYSDDFDLAYCKSCKLYEGSLTTDCSGEPSNDKSELIYNGKLDYREGEGWVNKLNPTNQNWLYSQIRAFVGGTSKYSHENEIILSFGTNKKEYDDVKNRVIKDLYDRRES